MFSFLYHTFLFNPFFNLLVILYNLVPGKDFGVAIILLTLLFRIALYPLSAKAIIAQQKMTALQPKAKEIQEKFKDDKDKQAKELLELYKREKINPFAGLLPLLIQLPLLLTLYQVFWNGLDAQQLVHLYSFVSNPTHIDPSFLGILDLSSKSWVLAILAAVLQFVQSMQMQRGKTGGEISPIQKQLTFMFPVITLFFVSQFAAAIGLYWVTTTLFSIAQQWYVIKRNGFHAK